MMKKIWSVLLLIFTIVLSGCGNLSDFSSDNEKQTLDVSSSADNNADSSDSKSEKNSSKKKKSSPKKSSADSEKLEVHFIDVGQGDSALITIGSHAMLVDAGDNSKGTAVQLYLEKQGISSLDYVIGTHPDSDHIGGLDVVIYKFDCKNVLMPDCSNNTATYRDVLDSMKSKSYKAVHPKAGTRYSLGDASFTITGPVRKYKETNDNSISFRLAYHDTSFLFMGDTTSDTEQDIMANTKNLRSDVLKVAHHGSKYSTSEEFLAEVSPNWAVISCAVDNHYGFPSARVLNLLRSSGTKVFRTDEQGSLVATSDGNKIHWNASPSTSWKAGENTQSSKSQATRSSNKTTQKNENSSPKNDASPNTKEQKKSTYIVNTNTKKFHKSSCRYASQISEENVEYSNESRDALTEKGYSPCGSCKP